MNAWISTKIMMSDVSGRFRLYTRTRVYLNTRHTYTLYTYQFTHKELENAANVHYDVLYGRCQLEWEKTISGGLVIIDFYPTASFFVHIKAQQ